MAAFCVCMCVNERMSVCERKIRDIMIWESLS